MKAHMMKTSCSILFLAAIVGLGSVDLSPAAAAYQAGRTVPPAGNTPHRMIVLTDIEADPDDTQSLYGRATRPGEKSFRDFKATLWRWRDDFQNDFAARMDWTIKSLAEANHPPLPVLDHPERLTSARERASGWAHTEPPIRMATA